MSVTCLVRSTQNHLSQVVRLGFLLCLVLPQLLDGLAQSAYFTLVALSVQMLPGIEQLTRISSMAASISFCVLSPLLSPSESFDRFLFCRDRTGGGEGVGVGTHSGSTILSTSSMGLVRYYNQC